MIVIFNSFISLTVTLLFWFILMELFSARADGQWCVDNLCPLSSNGKMASVLSCFSLLFHEALTKHRQLGAHSLLFSFSINVLFSLFTSGIMSTEAAEPDYTSCLPSCGSATILALLLVSICLHLGPKNLFFRVVQQLYFPAAISLSTRRQEARVYQKGNQKAFSSPKTVK